MSCGELEYCLKKFINNNDLKKIKIGTKEINISLDNFKNYYFKNVNVFIDENGDLIIDVISSNMSKELELIKNDINDLKKNKQDIFDVKKPLEFKENNDDNNYEYKNMFAKVDDF